MSRRKSTEARPHPWRRQLVLAGWLLSAVAVIARAAQIQVVQASEWRSVATRQHQDDQVLPAARGTILASNNLPLSVTRERVRVHIAPREVQAPDVLQRRLVDVLGVSPARAARLVTSGSGWNAAGVHVPAVRDSLRGLGGVHMEQVFERYYPHGDLARGVLGVVVDDEGRGGIERTFEERLRGVVGRQVTARDNRGSPLPGEQVMVQAPRAGGEVVLTLDMDLQEIAQAALLDAIEEHEAVGGDIIITNPFTGEILALFSIQDGFAGALSAVNTPFEPGSTLKPFTVAGLLDKGLHDLGDIVDVGDGTWVTEGRTLHDTHTEGRMTIREALRESSNIGIAKAAQVMTPGVQFENLRDFGFGALTGVELPGEVQGTLRRPDRWTAQSPASLAIGYEISVTPLQMVMAYGALANGGQLMRPRLVREVRDADGTVVESWGPEVVRRVVSRRTAESVGRALVDVVQGGTGSEARMGTFEVAGKSGTARFSSNGRYEQGDYSSSFAGYFPADAPQLVVFVKLDRPRSGGYYGGAVAAPVTRVAMEAALASNALNLGQLLDVSHAPDRDVPADMYATFASLPLEEALPPLEHVDAPDDEVRPSASQERIEVPDVAGLPARVAVRRLHRFGLRVTEIGSGDVVRSVPAAGAWVQPGDTVRLRYGGPAHE